MAKPSDHAVRAIATISERMGKYDHPTARKLHAEVERLRSGAEALDKVRMNRSPVDTREAHTLKVGNLAKKYESEATASLNRSLQIWGEGLDAIDKRIAEKVDLRPNAFAEEIRSAFRTLDRKEKLQLLGQLVKENRGPELAAIVKAPSILSGISDTDRANYEAAIIGTHAKAEVEEKARIEEVFDSVNAAQKAVSDLVRRFRDPGKLAEIERGDAAAKSASDQFNQALQ